MCISKKWCKLYGVGVNDADYFVAPKVLGVQNMCPFYQRWKDMLYRCYSPNAKIKYLTYKDAYVCEEWKTFTNFKKWMELQDWEGNDLDKDILVRGNKEYSPSTCAFVSSQTNTLILDSLAARGVNPIGVTKHGRGFRARSKNGCGSNVYIGTYQNIKDAENAYWSYKHKRALELSEVQSDPRIANALRTIFLDRIIGVK